MAEKIVIAELELNTKALQQSNTKLIQDISRLREEQKSLKKETGNLSTATDEQARKFIENDAALKKLSGQYNTNKKVLAENTTGIKGLNDALSKEISGVNEAKKNNKELINARNQVNTKTLAGQKAIAEINAKLDKNNKLIKDNSSNLEQQKIGIGGYEQGIASALSKVNLFGVNLGSVYKKGLAHQKGLIAQRTAMQGVTTATSLGSKALKLFRIALISTGIGAIVVLIGSLVAGFLSTQKGIDTVNKALAPLKGAFQGIIGVVQKLAVNIFGQLKDRWTVTLNSLLIGITNLRIKWNEFTGDDEEAESLKAYKNQLEKELEPAVERLKKKNEELSKIWKNAGNDIKEAAKAQQEIVNLGIEIEKKENDLIISRATLLDQLKEQEEIAKNTTLTDAERLKAINEAEKISNRLANKETEILDLKIKQKTLQNSLNDTDREAEKELNQIIAQRTQKQTENRARTLKFLGSRNSLEKQRQANVKKAIDNAIKESKTLLDIFIAEQGLKAKTLAEELKLAEEISTKKKEILKQELKAKKITQSEYNLAILELDNDLLSKRAEISVDNASRELQIFKDSHQAKLDANTFFTEELLNQETLRLDAVAQKEREYHEKRLEQGVINQQEYNDAINTVNEENRIAKEEAQALRDEAKKEQEIIDLENQRLIDEENFLTEFEIQSQRLETQRLQEVANAEKSGADIEKINRKFELRKEQLDRKQQVSKIQNTQNTFNQIGGLLKGFFGESKGLNIALATADMILGIQKAYVSQLIPGDPTSLPRAIGAGVQAGVFGAANVAKVAGVKFEKGGLQEVGGKRHTQGGTKFIGEDGTAFEAEQGELIGVMNRNASRLFMEFNDSYGGGASKSNVFQTGGFVQRQFASNNTSVKIDYDLLASKIGQHVGEANKNIPPNTLNLEYFNEAQSDLNGVIAGASR